MFNKFTKKLDFRILTIILTITLVLVIGVISVSAMFNSDSVTVSITEINNTENFNSTQKIKTDAKDVKELLSEQNITLSAHDFLNLDDNTIINDGMEIIITRGIAFNIEEDEHITLCSTTKTTVGDALLETGHYPDEDDIVTPAMDSPITPGLTISIIKVNNETLVVTETIANSIEYKDDNTLEKGKTKVLEEGHNGEYEVTYRIAYENGVETSREEVSRVVKKEPKNKVIANGTKTVKKAVAKTENKTQTTSASNSGGTIAGLKYKKKYTMSATGYTAFRSDGSRGKTASGRTARHGLVAVDPKVIPLGTKLYVEGYGEAIAADTGGAIKGNKIDLCFEMSNAEIRKQFGRKTLNVYVLE